MAERAAPPPTGRALGAALLGMTAAVALVALAFVGYFWAPVPETSARFLEWWTLAWVGFPLTGALIATRRPDTRIGWFLIGVGVAMAISRLAGIYLFRAHVTLAGVLPLDEPIVGLFIILGAMGDMGAFLLVGVALLHFPADRLPRGWRGPLWGTLLAAAVATLGLAFGPDLSLDDGTTILNPLAGGALTELARRMENAELGVALFLVAALGNLILRYRRGSPTVRRQLKWLAYPVALFLLTAVPFLIVHDETDFRAAVVWTGLFVVFFNGFAAAICLAVLRHRLYEIDRVVSRTVSYALLSSTLVALYLGAVFGLRSVVSGAGSSDIAVAASTLLVAAAFQPLRGRVQEVVDRRFNRARYDAQRTVEAFATRLRDEVDLDELAEELGALVEQTVAPAAVSVWVRGSSR